MIVEVAEKKIKQNEKKSSSFLKCKNSNLCKNKTCPHKEWHTPISPCRKNCYNKDGIAESICL